MNSGRKYDDSPNFRRPEPSRRSIFILFAVGSCLLVIPLAVVLSANYFCRIEGVCHPTEDYRIEVSAFPYVMIGGGIIIGYNMKRISDAARYDEERDGDGGSSTPISR